MGGGGGLRHDCGSLRQVAVAVTVTDSGAASVCQAAGRSDSKSSRSVIWRLLVRRGLATCRPCRERRPPAARCKMEARGHIGGRPAGRPAWRDRDAAHVNDTSRRRSSHK